MPRTAEDEADDHWTEFGGDDRPDEMFASVGASDNTRTPAEGGDRPLTQEDVGKLKAGDAVSPRKPISKGGHAPWFMPGDVLTVIRVTGRAGCLVEVEHQDGRAGMWAASCFERFPPLRPIDRPDREAEAPVAVVIDCPVCKAPHIDEGEWATTRHHKTHQCQSCGHEWRPFPYATVGVPANPQPLGGEYEGLKELLLARVADHIGRPIDHAFINPSGLEAAKAITDLEERLSVMRQALEKALANVAYQPGDHPIVPIKHDAFVKAVQRIAAQALSTTPGKSDV